MRLLLHNITIFISRMFIKRIICINYAYLLFLGELFVFYSIFYIVLAALFTICMKGLLATCPTNMPKWQLGESLIGASPGVGFRPLPEDVDHGSLIWYDASNQTQITHWKELLDDYLHGL